MIIRLFEQHENSFHPDDGYICIAKTCSYVYVYDKSCVLTVMLLFFLYIHILEHNGDVVSKNLKNGLTLRLKLLHALKNFNPLAPEFYI